MPRPFNAVPVYSRHKASNQAICTVRLANGRTRDIYLGKWNSAASKTEYQRIVALVNANGGAYPDADADADLSVNEALARYVKSLDTNLIDADRN